RADRAPARGLHADAAREHAHDRPRPTPMNAPLLRVRDLHKRFPVQSGLLARRGATLAAVDGVSFDIEPGRTLGLVGESGCGKTTRARIVGGRPERTSAAILLEGEPMTGLSAAGWRARRRSVQMVFQDPHASLDPRYTVARTLREPLDVHAIGAAGERDA